MEYDQAIDISKRSEKFSAVIFSLVTYLLEYFHVEESALDKLEAILAAHNKSEVKAYSIPFACVALVNFIYTNHLNLGAVIELANRMITLPPRYRYWTISLAISIHAMHIRSEQLEDESKFDFLMYLKCAEFIAECIRSEKFEGITDEQESQDLMFSCSISLARLTFATIPSFFDVKTLPYKMTFTFENRPQIEWIKPFGRFLCDYLDVLNQSISFYYSIAIEKNYFIDRLTLRWMRNLYFESTLSKYAGEAKAELVLTLPYFPNTYEKFTEFFTSKMGDLEIYHRRNFTLVADSQGAQIFILACYENLNKLEITGEIEMPCFPIL